MAPPIDLQHTEITITINMTGVPTTPVGFGTVMYLSPNFVPVSGNTLTLLPSTDLQALATAGVINAKMASDLAAAFGQNPAPGQIKLGKVAYLTLATDLATVRGEDDDWYCAVLDLVGQNVANKETYLTTLAAEIEAISPVKRFHVCQSEDPDMYAATTLDIAAKEYILAHERTSVIFSNLYSAGAAPGTLDQPAALCAACRWLAFDPDLQSAPFRAQISGMSSRCKVTATLVDLSAAEIAYILGSNKNGNVLQLYGSASTFLQKGTNAKGRACEEVLSRDWLEARIRADIATEAVATANRGQKWPLTQEGVAKLSAIVGRWMSTGVQAGHFSDYSIGEGTINTTTKTISLPYVRATYLDNTLKFAVVVNFD